MPKYGVFSGPYFPVFELNTEICGVNLRIQSEYRKIRTRKKFRFGHFLHCDFLTTNVLFNIPDGPEYGSDYHDSM